MKELQIRTFRDQSTDRHEVYELCARFACDILSMIDDATGADPDAGSQEMAEEYVRQANKISHIPLAYRSTQLGTTRAAPPPPHHPRILQKMCHWH